MPKILFSPPPLVTPPHSVAVVRAEKNESLEHFSIYIQSVIAFCFQYILGPFHHTLMVYFAVGRRLVSPPFFRHYCMWVKEE